MIQIDFEKFNKAGLKPILTKLGNEGLTVADVQADNKAKRESGYQVKTATITFDSGQKLMLKAKAGGSIYQVRLNNKVVPIKHYEDLDKAVLEIINYVQANEKRYLQQKEKQIARQKVTVPKIKPVSTTVAEQINTFKTALAESQAAADTLVSQISEIDAANTEKGAAVASLSQELNGLLSTGEQLQAQYDELMKEAA